MAAWESGVAANQPSGTCSRRRPTKTPAAAAKLSLLRTARCSARLRPDALHVPRHGADRSCPRSRRFGWSCCTDPNLPARRPGPLVQGDLRPDADQDRSPRRPRATRKTPSSRSPRRPPTSTSPRRRWSRTSTIARTRKRVVGPVAFAIDGKDETAWGIDAGPGRRNQAAQGGVLARRTPIEFPAGAVVDGLADAESRRLEQRRPPEQPPRPVPHLA